MKLIKNGKKYPNLAKVASTDASRPVLNSINYDVDRAVIEATDSYRLVSIPVEVEEGDTSGLIPMDAWASFYKAHKASQPAPSLACGETVEYRDISGARFSWDRPTGQFPNVPALIPDDLNEFKIGLNAKMLADLAVGMASEDDVVYLQFVNNSNGIEPNPLRPIVVTNRNENVKGLLMPVRIN